ncbi:hypothetical protein [Candidatus Williamhamiltonella defendens]|nr:hypothetical protein [Candidatus Hamiltonella defensa]
MSKLTKDGIMGRRGKFFTHELILLPLNLKLIEPYGRLFQHCAGFQQGP